MDNETFIQLLNMVGQAGHGAFWLALFYILKGYFAWTVLGILVAFLYVKTGQLIATFHIKAQTCNAVYKRLFNCTPYELDYSDYRKIMDELDRILK